MTDMKKGGRHAALPENTSPVHEGTARPYAAAAWRYRGLDYTGIIPVGYAPAQKSPPAKGYTGWSGIDPSGPDVQAWIDGREGTFNIGWHIPHGYLVIDVDAYHGGDVTLAALEAKAGRKLPPTWSNTSKGQTDPSRHLVYRAVLPEGRVWIDHPGGIDGGIDMLHVGHRYAVVWPSVHDKTGDTYHWYDADGELYEDVPALGWFTSLDDEWITDLSQPGVPLEGVEATDGETRDALDRFRVGPPCPCVGRQLGKELDRIAAARAGQGGIHMPGPLYALVAFGLEGHVGVGAALSQHQAAYVEARVESRGESEGQASAAWWRQVRGAVGKKLHATGGAILAQCRCGQPPAAPAAVVEPAEEEIPDLDTLRAELAALTEPEHKLKVARDVAARLADVDDGEAMVYRDLLKAEAGLTVTDFRAIVRAERKRAKEALKAPTDGDWDSKKELPSRGAPLPVAFALFERFDGRNVRIRQWRDDWYLHRDTHWAMVKPSKVRALVYKETGPCWYDDPEEGPKAWNPDTAAVNKVIDALGHDPAYRPDEDDEATCIAAANGVLSIDGDRRELLPHTPERFNLWALPYAYEPAAQCPGWEAFLTEVMPNPENRQLLQEWFGYMISGRTDLQKILSMFGAPRSGKGTVLRVLVGMLGEQNRATVTLNQLAATFGQESLVGKAMAQITDANWNIREIDVAVEALKSISGEDDRGVDRKNRTTWEGKLGCRFVLVANSMPRFNDPSGALLGRMLHIEFTRSFLGREDTKLTPRLLTELPGILNWALDGLVALNERGRLITPAASIEAAEEIERTTSPVASFLRDRTDYVDPGKCVGIYLDELYEAYRSYCGGPAGIGRVTSRDVFSRDLRAAAAGRVVVKRTWVDRGTDRARQLPQVFGLSLTDVVRDALAH